VSKRIFWRQLFTLTAVCGIYSLGVLPVYVIAFLGLRCERKGHLDCGDELWNQQWFRMTCVYFGRFWQYSAQLVEVQIAAGFFAVVYEARRLHRVLRSTSTIAFTFVISFSALLFQASVVGWEVRKSSAMYQWGVFDHWVWEWFSVVCFITGVCLYVLSIVGLRTDLGRLRTPAVFCGVLYGLADLATSNFVAYLHLASVESEYAKFLGRVLMNLSGTFIVCVYAVFTWRVLGPNTHARFEPEVARLRALSEGASVFAQQPSSVRRQSLNVETSESDPHETNSFRDYFDIKFIQQVTPPTPAGGRSHRSVRSGSDRPSDASSFTTFQ
jgi:hypothetical protein